MRREPAGSPKGGQFSVTARPEPDVRLGRDGIAADVESGLMQNDLPGTLDRDEGSSGVSDEHGHLDDGAPAPDPAASSRGELVSNSFAGASHDAVHGSLQRAGGWVRRQWRLERERWRLPRTSSGRYHDTAGDAERIPPWAR